ncbi:MAG: ISNCY family transposase, partial [Sedimenticolaceae bacterium]
SPWVYRKLRNFRAGIEAGISVMKRAYGLGRCTWKGLQHFRAYQAVEFRLANATITRFI